MRLKKEQIQKVSELILKALQDKKLVTLKAGADRILARINRAITDDLMAEDKLDDEVKRIMDQYRAMITSGQMNEQEVFNKIKKQLIKDRKMVI
jgi:hypothetical protein